MRFGRLRKNPVYIHLSAGVLYGSMMGATPDGRKAGMPLAEGGISPMQGLALNGPSASMRSAAKWDYSEINSVVYNQKFHPRALEKEDDVQKLASLIRIYYVIWEKMDVEQTMCRSMSYRQKHLEMHRNIRKSTGI